MRTAIALDDDLVCEARRLTGTSEKRAHIRQALQALTERESARCPTRLAGSEPGWCHHLGGTRSLGDPGRHLRMGRSLRDWFAGCGTFTRPWLGARSSMGHGRTGPRPLVPVPITMGWASAMLTPTSSQRPGSLRTRDCGLRMPHSHVTSPLHLLADVEV